MKEENEFEAPDWVQNENKSGADSALKDMSSAQRRFLTGMVVIAVPFCMWAGWFEWGRAHQGNWRAWVYTFEWPFFGAIAIYLWRRLTKGDLPKIPRPNFEELAKEFDAKKEEEKKNEID